MKSIIYVLLIGIIIFILYYNKSYIIKNIEPNKNIKIEKKEEIEIEPKLEPIDDKLLTIFENTIPKLQTTFSNSLNDFDVTSSLPKVFLNINIGKKNIGQIIIKLFTNNVPKTCENFSALCSGARGYTKNGNKLSYKNSIFHRIIPNFMIQGGDILNNNGTGAISIYGNSFDDENFMIQHNKPGIVSMANSGPNTNGSQFFIITQPQPHLDGVHVAFGQVIFGLELLDEIESYGTKSGDPTSKIIISDC
jgi:peptidylprolyl isomerase